MVAATVGLALAVASAAGAATPIPSDPAPVDAPVYEGAPATPRRLAAPQPPRHPFMAPNGRSNLHNDGFQSDTYWIAGPLGRELEVVSTAQFADCASVTFDSRGRIVTVCVGVDGPRLMRMDAKTLDTISTFTLPPRIPGGASIFNDFAGGGYFYLDDKDRAVVPTTTRHLFVVGTRDDGFELERDYDLTGAVPVGDKIISALPDWSGRYWFASTKGVMGTIDPASGAVRSLPLGEDIANSFAVDDSGGVYVVTQEAMYRLDPAADGTPSVTWRIVYDNSGIAKPGQVHAGSGTTPTVMNGGRVAIADNADPMNVVVYKRGRSVTGSRAGLPAARVRARGVRDRPVADRARNSIVVENNYGHDSPDSVRGGKTTTPGIERVDLAAKGRGCRKVWHSNEIAPSVVPKLSVETGLVYTYTKPRRDDGADPWYFTALDFCTGRTVYRRLAGTGLGFNNNFAPVTLGADGSAYVGALGGLIRLYDARPPTGPPPGARKGCRPKPRVALRLRYRRGPGGCAREPVVASVTGADRRKVRRAGFFLGRKRRGPRPPRAVPQAHRPPAPRSCPRAPGHGPGPHEGRPAGHAARPLPRLPRAGHMSQAALRNRLVIASAMWREATTGSRCRACRRVIPRTRSRSSS